MIDYFLQAERSLNFLQESEEAFARLKATHQANDHRRKIVRAGLALDSSESSQSGKILWAEAHVEYTQAVNDWRQSVEDYELINAKRIRACLLIEMFRSTHSAQKKGNI